MGRRGGENRDTPRSARRVGGKRGGLSGLGDGECVCVGEGGVGVRIDREGGELVV